MKKRFIILVDFFEGVENLLKYAYDWSKQIEVEVLLMHQTTPFVPTFADSSGRASIIEQYKNEARQKLVRLAKENFPTSGKLSYSISDQPLQLQLQEHLQEDFEDLVFLALKRTQVAQRIILGSTASQLIDKIDNNIVAMPTEISTFSPEFIYVAVTKKYPLNILALNNLLNFMEKPKRNLIFFYLAEPKEETKPIEKYLRDLTNLFRPHFNSSYTIYEKSNYFTSIKEVINDKIDELLIVQKGSRHITNQLFRRFMVNDLIFEGKTPLIILP